MSNNVSGFDIVLAAMNCVSNSIYRKNIAQSNEENKQVTQYSHVDIAAVFTPDTFNENTIISGNDTVYRDLFLKYCLYNCSIQKNATIVLHNHNRELEQYISSSLPNSIINNAVYKNFEPIRDFDFLDLVQVLNDVGQKKYNLLPEFQSLLQVIYELKPKGATELSFNALLKCPVYNISNILLERLTQNMITQDNYNRLNALVINGQNECVKLSNLLQELNRSMSHLISSQNNAHSILSAIKNGLIMVFDVQSVTNITELDFVLSSIMIAINKGYNITLVLDDVANVQSEQFTKIVTTHASNFNFIISAKDYASLLNQKEDVFSSSIGISTKTVLFRHSSNVSCEKWAKYLGEYEKKEISDNTGSTLGGFGFSMNKGMTVSDKREYRIKPEQIMNIGNGQAIIYDGKTNELMIAHELA